MYEILFSSLCWFFGHVVRLSWGCRESAESRLSGQAQGPVSRAPQKDLLQQVASLPFLCSTSCHQGASCPQHVLGENRGYYLDLVGKYKGMWAVLAFST